jgi:mycofactocin precursor
MVKEKAEAMFEVMKSKADKDEIFKTEEITVEELAIDGICGVY